MIKQSCLTQWFAALAVWTLLAGWSSAQIAKPFPAKAGYVCPAGGQRDSTFEVMVAGRLISRTVDAVFSGDGVSAKVIDTFPWPRNLEQRDRYEIRNRVVQVASRHVSDSPQGKRMKDLIDRLPKANKPPDPPEEIAAVPFIWPRHATLRKICEPDAVITFDETLELIYLIYGPGMWRRAPDPLLEIVILEITIAPDAEPGDRELRLLTNFGLTNPLYFQVGVHPEAMEKEPNSPDNHGIADFMLGFEPPVYETPVVLNGQITHADIDRFRFRAKKGEPLVLAVQARQLMPYLADAVPGWFEAVLTVYDENERELRYADCNGFRADPVMVFTPPEDGIYIAEVRDSLFRGREDFVYRLSIAKTPLVRSVFPAGVREGEKTTLKIEGVNLPVQEIEVEGTPGPERLRSVSRIGDAWLPLPVRYAIDSLPEMVAMETNRNRETALAVTFPVTINGRIAEPGQYGFYRFEGKSGQQIELEVVARRIDSPLDSRITVFDAKGEKIAENDDGPAVDEKFMSQLPGTQTHNADSRLIVTLPHDGEYFVRIGDATRQGGPDYVYRLRISPPRPDFFVYTTPSGINLPARVTSPIWFKVRRGEGFTGPVEIRLLGDAQGFTFEKTVIPADKDEVQAPITAPDEVRKIAALRFEAVATWEGGEIRRPVHAVEDMEQAFLYHHLVPASHLWIYLNTRK